ncbi:uncharacterized protein [Coffea arabica]|uniref:RNase H type-1 domain-containing protein n=1 Tax=Coffea arabica TaxID=13443 RepID=A0A6P6XLE8_COFAR|nr:uncharacterized protein LOC113743963 [Coffea arabica]
MLNEEIVDLSEDIRWEFGGYKMVKRRGLFIGSYKVNIAPLRNKSRFDDARFEMQEVTRRLVISWKRPLQGAVKLNTDASVSKGKASGGGLLRDHEGKLIFAFYKEIWEVDVLMAKSLALLHGLQLYKRTRVQNLLVEVDSAGLVQLLETRSLTKGPLCSSLRRIQELLRSLHSTVTHIFWEANSAADKLAMMEAQDDFPSAAIQQLSRGIRATILLVSREIPLVGTQVVRE